MNTYPLKRLLLALALVAMTNTTGAQTMVEVGEPAPRSKMTLIDGSTLQKNAFQDKVVLTVFWATWCHICMNELPEFQKLRDRYHEAGFEILGLSVDEQADPVREYISRSGFTFPVAMRTSALKRTWGPVPGTPLLYISDSDGIVRVRHLGAMQIGALEAEIVSLLAARKSRP